MSEALAIYVVAGRDVVDALDMISECTDVAALRDLLAMCESTGTERTDHVLNKMLVRPIKMRLMALEAL